VGTIISIVFVRCSFSWIVCGVGFALIACPKSLLVRHVLQHTGGNAPSFAFDELSSYTPAEAACIKINEARGIVTLANESQRGVTLEAHVQRLAKTPLASVPGAQFCYGLGLDIAGLLLFFTLRPMYHQMQIILIITMQRYKKGDWFSSSISTLIGPSCLKVVFLFLCFLFLCFLVFLFVCSIISSVFLSILLNLQL
jgi:hypothetical protein